MKTCSWFSNYLTKTVITEVNQYQICQVYKQLIRNHLYAENYKTKLTSIQIVHNNIINNNNHNNVFSIFKF